MGEKQTPPSLWQTARVETSVLAVLVLAWCVANAAGWVPNVNSSLAVLVVYAAWLGLCIVVYRYFYKLDT